MNFISLEDISMGLLNYISKAIDTVTTTVKEWVAPQSVSKVSSTQKPKETVQMVSKETQEAQKNEDTVEIQSKTADAIYKKIEEMCVDYKMSMEDVKKAKLLEGILGCTTEELVKQSDEDIDKALEALQFTLSWQSWKLPFQSRDMEDIKEITINANQKFIALKTGRSCWSDQLRWSTPLADRLKDAGYNEVTKENVEKYFDSMITEAVASGDKEKINEAYTEALKTFGDLLNDTEDPQHKEMLTAAISKLQASVRATAAELSIRSCGNNNEARQCVARGIASNYRAMACTTDAYKERTTSDDNTKISQIAFSNMSEEDSLAALAETKAYNNALAAKAQNGEPISEDEKYYLDSVRIDYYSGAIVGSSYNPNYSTPDNVINTINTDITEQGIQEPVYAATANYVNAHQDSLPITVQQFTQTVNRATGGNYTTVLENCPNNGGTYVVNRNSSTNNKASKNNQTNAPTNKGADNSQKADSTDTTTTKAENTQTAAAPDMVPTYGTPDAVVAPSDTVPAKPQHREHTAQQREEEEAPPQQVVSSPVQDLATRKKAIQSGVKAVKEYVKENNVSAMDLAIESLNSNSASSSTKKWALAQFEAASNAEQLLNFHKISNGANAMAAARTMDDKTRSQIRDFRSYYIKESVENLNENSLA